MQQSFFSKILVTENEVLNDQIVVVENGLITDISPAAASTAKPDFYGEYLVPSFIDLQIYGAREKLFSMYPSPDTLHAVYEHCIAKGTSHFVVTVATNTQAVMHEAINAVRAYWKAGGKGLLGLHLEGPWINPLKRGAHIEAFVKCPGIDEVRQLLEYGKGVIKMITLAPEVCKVEVINLIRSFDVVISAGHSNATYQEATESFSQGITAVTHMYNAMSSFHHRDTGLPGAAFAHSTVMSSIIVDGHHVDYSAVSIAKRLMGDRLFLITDAVTETKEGPYQHTYFDGRYLSAGTLSGSALTMLDAVKNCIKHCGIPAEEAFRMASTYPARLMGMRTGTIALGETSAFILLDEKLEIIKA